MAAPFPRRHRALRGSSCLRQPAGQALVGSAPVPLPPLCAPLFAICLAGGCRLPSEPHLLPAPGLGAVRGLPQNNAGTPSGGRGQSRFVSAWPPLTLTAKPRWARGPGPCRGFKEGLCGQECGDRRQGWPQTLSPFTSGLGLLRREGSERVGD